MLTAPTEVPPPVEQEEPALATAELELGGMHCSACATRIQKSLGRLPAVASASVNLATTRAFVSYDPGRLTRDELCRAVADVGYSASPVDAATGSADRDSDHWGLRAALSWPLAIAALIVSLAAPETAIAGWTVLILGIAVEFAGGWPFLRDSARLLRHGATSMDTLIAAGHPGRAGGQRRRGHRAGRASPPPGRQWRLRRPPPRCDGPPHRVHPGDRKGDRVEGPGPGGPGHALPPLPPPADGAGGLRRGRRCRRAGGAGERSGRRAWSG